MKQINPNFLEPLFDYVNNPRRLDRLSPPYEVEPPEVLETVILSTGQRDDLYSFRIKNDHGVFGGFSVLPHYGPGHYLYLFNIDTGSYASAPEGKPYGYGRQIVRCLTAYADDYRYDGLRTSGYTSGAGPFWTRYCFRPTGPVRPHWEKADDPAAANVWRKKVAQDPDALWDLARTEIGRRILHVLPTSGVLNLRNRKQRDAAIASLKLQHYLKAAVPA